jgi:hypothetical protein
MRINCVSRLSFILLIFFQSSMSVCSQGQNITIVDTVVAKEAFGADVTMLDNGDINGTVSDEVVVNPDVIECTISEEVEDSCGIQAVAEDLKLKISDLYEWIVEQVVHQHPYLSVAGIATLTGAAVYLASQMLRSVIFRGEYLSSEYVDKDDLLCNKENHEISCACLQVLNEYGSAQQYK